MYHPTKVLSNVNNPDILPYLVNDSNTLPYKSQDNDPYTLPIQIQDKELHKLPYIYSTLNPSRKIIQFKHYTVRH